MRSNHTVTLALDQSFGAATALRRLADAIDTLSGGDVAVDPVRVTLTVEDDHGERDDQLDDMADALRLATAAT